MLFKNVKLSRCSKIQCKFIYKGCVIVIYFLPLKKRVTISEKSSQYSAGTGAFTRVLFSFLTRRDIFLNSYIFALKRSKICTENLLCTFFILNFERRKLKPKLKSQNSLKKTSSDTGKNCFQY